MASTLDGLMARLKRADEHIEGLRGMQAELINEDFCRSEPQIDRHKRAGLRRIVCRVIAIEEFPPAYTIAIGEAAHSMRAVLDNIAFAIAKPIAGKEKQVQFPIFKRSQDFRHNAPRMLPGISVRERAAFERLQPYHRRKMSGAEYLLHLNALSNWDKHRAIAVCALNGVMAGMHVEIEPPFRIVRHRFTRPGRLEVGAIIATFHARADPGTPKGTQGNVKMNPALMIAVAFDKRMTPPAGGANVLLVLDSCRHYIEYEVIRELQRFL